MKIEWLFKKNAESPYFVNVPDTLKTLSFIEKDSKQFPDTNGWAYAVFLNDPTTDTLTPDGHPRKMGPVLRVAIHAIQRWRQKITFSQRTRKGKRARNN